jgi:hypothetical protein
MMPNHFFNNEKRRKKQKGYKTKQRKEGVGLREQI